MLAIVVLLARVLRQLAGKLINSVRICKMKKLNYAFPVMRDELFACRGWQRKRCPHCSGDYYAKRGQSHCNSYACSGGYTFLSVPSPKRQLDLGACVSALTAFFNGRGYKSHQPIAVVRKEERTLFASTAGQIYDHDIYGEVTEESVKRHLVVQPVIRLQELESIPLTDGIASSFVHGATECWGVAFKDHLETFDQWLDFFSELGLYVGNLCLKVEQDGNDWAGRIVTSEMLRIHYGGLEVGVANFFFDIPQPACRVATLSDVGIGLERLVWAINKSLKYLDSIGPFPYVRINKREVLHAIRTATLMVGSGVVPSHRNHGSKLRAMTKIVAGGAYALNLYELVGYYYRQWSTLTGDLSVTQDQVYSIILGEVNRELGFRTDMTQ